MAALFAVLGALNHVLIYSVISVFLHVLFTIKAKLLFFYPNVLRLGLFSFHHAVALPAKFFVVPILGKLGRMPQYGF